MKNEAQKPFLKNAVRALFLLLIVSLGFMQPVVFAAGQRLTPTDLLFPAAAILWIIALLSGQLKFKWHRYYLILGGYFAALLISAIFSLDPKTSFIKLIAEGYLLGLAVLTFNLVNDVDDLRRVSRAWLLGAAFAVAIGVLTILLFYIQPENPLLEYTLYHYGAVPVGNYPRVSSTFVSASMFCNYLNVGLALLFIAKELEWIGKTLFWIFLVSILICSVFTISAGLGGIFLSVGFWIWLKFRRSRIIFARSALIGGIAISVLLLTFSLISLQSLQSLQNFRIGELQPSSRLLVWSDAVKTFSENPVTGKGIGQRVSGVVYQNTDGSASLLTDAHNTFLSIAAQCGTIGLFALLALAGYILRESFVMAGGGLNKAAFSRDQASFIKTIKTGLGLAFLSAFVYQGLTGSFEDARHLWVLIGIIPALGYKKAAD
jgi:O-antigen ligase